ncbi:unnamed protein product [Meloidogyne enterolobii]|uniref:Uncharacterized protein n=4 Tax=Meloidogyne enterolobii TaxID=390850 RepID=A0A6V7XFM1_MELEN|nr:unnamed protein product [Meloidogyne enterolobii]
MWDIAPEFGAAIVFAEHRYYGESLPFGNETYSNISTMAYLSSEQALGDFAVLIKYLKEKRIINATKKAVVSFGGSYGGMLTAWMRIKVYNFFRRWSSLCVQSKNNWIFLSITKLGYGSKAFLHVRDVRPLGLGHSLPYPSKFLKVKLFFRNF